MRKDCDKSAQIPNADMLARCSSQCLRPVVRNVQGNTQLFINADHLPELDVDLLQRLRNVCFGVQKKEWVVAH
jgi:hypothetical protein